MFKNRATTMTIAALASLTFVSAAPATAQEMEMGGDERGAGPAFERFDEIDANKDGKITVEEVTIYRQSMVEGTDANADGKLSADELTAQEVRRMAKRAEARAARMIERFDADGDGLLSAAELATRPMPVMLFERLDADGDGAVSREEAEAAREMMAERRGKHRGWMHNSDEHERD